MRGSTPRLQAPGTAFLPRGSTFLSPAHSCCPSPPRPAAVLPGQLTTVLARDRALCFFLTVSQSPATFPADSVLSPCLFVCCAQSPLLSRNFSTVECSAHLPECLAPTLLPSGGFLDSPSSEDPAALHVCMCAPWGRGPVAVPTWSGGPSFPAFPPAPLCLLASSPPSPPPGPHLWAAVSGGRKVDVDLYAPYVQDGKQIQAQRKRRLLGWKEQARTGMETTQRKIEEDWVELQGKKKKRRETRGRDREGRQGVRAAGQRGSPASRPDGARAGGPPRGVASPVPAPGPGAPGSPASTAGTSSFVYSGPLTDLRDPPKLPRAASHCSFPQIWDTPPGGRQTLPVLGGCQLSPPTHGRQRQPKEPSDLLPPPSPQQWQQPLVA